MTYKELAEHYNDMVVCVREMEREQDRADAALEDVASDIYSLKQSPFIYSGDLEDEIEECRNEAYERSDTHREKAAGLLETLHVLSSNDEKIEALIENTESSSVYMEKALEQIANESFANENISPLAIEMLEALCQKSPELDERYWTKDAVCREDLKIPDIIPEIEEIKESLRKETRAPKKSVRSKLASMKDKVRLPEKKKENVCQDIGEM